MKNFRTFIIEAARLVGFIDHLKYREPDSYHKNTDTDTELKRFDVAISRLNKIASKHSAYFDRIAIQGHFKKRVKKRGFNINSIVDTIQRAEKTTMYFDDLKENSGLIINDKGPQIIYRKKKQHLGTIIKRNGRQIIIKSIMGDFSERYIRDLEEMNIPLYFVR